MGQSSDGFQQWLTEWPINWDLRIRLQVATVAEELMVTEISLWCLPISYYFFWLGQGIYCQYWPREWLGRVSPKWPILYQVGR